MDLLWHQFITLHEFSLLAHKTYLIWLLWSKYRWSCICVVLHENSAQLPPAWTAKKYWWSYATLEFPCGKHTLTPIHTHRHTYTNIWRCVLVCTFAIVALYTTQHICSASAIFRRLTLWKAPTWAIRTRARVVAAVTVYPRLNGHSRVSTRLENRRPRYIHLHHARARACGSSISIKPMPTLRTPQGE